MIRDTLWLRVALGVLCVLAAGCQGGGGDDGGAATAQCVAASEGSTAVPIPLTVGVSHSGSVSCFGISTYKASVTLSAYAVVTLSNLSDEVVLYTSDQSFGNWDWNSITNNSAIWSAISAASGPTLRSHSVANSIPSDLYIAVLGEGTTTTPVTYTLDIQELATPVDEGTSGVGGAMAVATSHSGTVSFPGQSYYHFTIDQTVNNSIVLTGEDSSGLGIHLFQDDTNYAATPYLDAGSPAGSSGLAIPANAFTGSDVFVQVDGSGTDFGAIFTISLQASLTIYNADDNCCILKPVAPLGTPTSVQLESRAFSAYQTPAVSGQTYLATLTAPGQVDLEMSDVNAFNSGTSCAANWLSAGGSTRKCRLKATSALIYTGDNGNATAGGSTGTILVELSSAPPAEGTSVSPMALGTAPIYASARTVNTVASYYTVAVTPNAQYMVTVAPDQAVGLDVYDTPTFTGSPLCSASVVANTAKAQHCPIVSTVGTIYIRVNGSQTSGAGAAFQLHVMK